MSTIKSWARMSVVIVTAIIFWWAFVVAVPVLINHAWLAL